MPRSHATWHRRPAAWTAVALTVSVCVAGLPAPAVAGSSQVYYRAEDGTLTIAGHGFGHGHGMSQWGAYGRAAAGHSAPQILKFYYPGTTSDTIGLKTELTVRLTALEDSSGTLPAVEVDTRRNPDGGDAGTDPDIVVTSPGHTALTLASTVETGGTAATGVHRWRLVPSGTGLVLQYMDANGWHAYPATGDHPEWSGLLDGGSRFMSTGAVNAVRVRVSPTRWRDYRGNVEVVRSGTGARAVNHVWVEDYLRSVVAWEMSPSWRLEALKAQSIAARTYAADKVNRPRSSSYDLFDNTNDQAYRGMGDYSDDGVTAVASYEFASTDSAVSGTKGQILSYGGKPILAQFSASNGGYTASGNLTYLPGGVSDTYDGYAGNSGHSWQRTLTATDLARLSAAIKSKKGVDVGSVLRLVVGQRDGYGEWGGRILSLQVAGDRGSATIKGTEFRSYVGTAIVKSEWFAGVPLGCTVARVSGDTRYDTNVAQARAAFPSSAGIVVVSSVSGHLVDGVVAAPFAYAKSSPVLVADGKGLPPSVSAEIARRKPTTAWVVGGPRAVPTTVEAQLKGLGVKTVTRLAGEHPEDTAAAVARAMAPSGVSRAIIASMDGNHLVDALAAGGAGARSGIPILLTARDVVPAATSSALTALGVKEAIVVGGPVVVDKAWGGLAKWNPIRLAGDRAPDTAVVVAEHFASAMAPTTAVVTSYAPDNLVDALGAGTFGRATLLVAKAEVPTATKDWLLAQNSLERGLVMGGPLAISDPVFGSVQKLACR